MARSAALTPPWCCIAAVAARNAALSDVRVGWQNPVKPFVARQPVATGPRAAAHPRTQCGSQPQQRAHLMAAVPPRRGAATATNTAAHQVARGRLRCATRDRIRGHHSARKGCQIAQPRWAASVTTLSDGRGNPVRVRLTPRKDGGFPLGRSGRRIPLPPPLPTSALPKAGGSPP